MLPPFPSGKYKRTMARLYTLVGKTGRPGERRARAGEELVALRKAQLVAQVAKRPPAPRTR